MSVYNQTRLIVDDQINELKDLLDQLRHEILASFQDGIVWYVPAPKWEDHSTLTVERHTILPEEIRGTPSAEFASGYYGQMNFEQDQSPIYSSRAPGILSVSSSAVTLARSVNEAKKSIKKTMVEQVEPGSRRRFVRDILNQPGLNLNYVYRTIKILPTQTSFVRFMWEDKQMKHSKLAPEDVHRLCDRARVLRIDEEWNAEMSRIRDAADQGVAIVQRAPQPPKVRAGYKIPKDDSAQWKSFDACTPLITDEPLPDISPLSPWTEKVAGTSRQTRDDHGEYRLLSENLRLYSCL